MNPPINPGQAVPLGAKPVPPVALVKIEAPDGTMHEFGPDDVRKMSVEDFRLLQIAMATGNPAWCAPLFKVDEG